MWIWLLNMEARVQAVKIVCFLLFWKIIVYFSFLMIFCNLKSTLAVRCSRCSNWTTSSPRLRCRWSDQASASGPSLDTQQLRPSDIFPWRLGGRPGSFPVLGGLDGMRRVWVGFYCPGLLYHTGSSIYSLSYKHVWAAQLQREGVWGEVTSL